MTNDTKATFGRVMELRLYAAEKLIEALIRFTGWPIGSAHADEVKIAYVEWDKTRRE